MTINVYLGWFFPIPCMNDAFSFEFATAINRYVFLVREFCISRMAQFKNYYRPHSCTLYSFNFLSFKELVFVERF